MSERAETTSPLVVWRTLRHLRARQIAGQVRRRVRRALGGAPGRPGAGAPPPFPGCRWEAPLDVPPPGAQLNRARDLLSGRFVFLNRPVELGWPPRWNPDLPLLWRYNLHYFEWLWALDYEHAREAVLDWIAHHGPDGDRVGWEPYPLSLRLTSWLTLFWGRFGRRIADDRPLREAVWNSVFRQVECLSGNLEWHLLGNHLLENAAALTCAGACFEGSAARRWYARGARLLEDELGEQMLPDGMHFERSPMYHLRATYLLVLLSGCGPESLSRRLAATLDRALEATTCLLHPDGGIALVNDSAFGIQNRPSELLGAAAALSGSTTRRPADGPWALPSAGYFGFRGGGHYVICDAGPIGPDHVPAHGHGDLLSFELSLDGRRAIVDSGVYDYERSEMRRYCRSTRAHNTVEIDGADQCEFWAAFRVGRRANPFGVEWRPDAEGFRLRGAHDGYRRLRGSPVHERTVHWHRAGRLEIEDRVTARRPVRAVARLHLHPDWQVTSWSDTRAEVSGDGARWVVRWSGGSPPVRESSLYCPEFGRRIPNLTLAFPARGSRIETRLAIEAR